MSSGGASFVSFGMMMGSSIRTDLDSILDKKLAICTTSFLSFNFSNNHLVASDSRVVKRVVAVVAVLFAVVAK